MPKKVNPGDNLSGFQSWILTTDRPRERAGEAAAFFGRSAATDPDVLVIQPEEDKNAVSIDQLRALPTILGTNSLTGRDRLVLITPADTLAPAAQQSLLKILEEPPAGTILALLARSAGALPDTIVSRCLVQALEPNNHSGGPSILHQLAQAPDLAARLRLLDSLPKEREELKQILAVAVAQPVPPTQPGIMAKAAAVKALEALQVNVTPQLALDQLALSLPKPPA